MHYSMGKHNHLFATKKKNMFKFYDNMNDCMIDCIQQALAVLNTVLMTTGECTIILLLKDGTYSLFHSHSRPNLCEVADSGHSAFFSTFANMLVYFEELVNSLGCDQHHVIGSVTVTIV